VKADRGLTIERMVELGRVSRSGFYRFLCAVAEAEDGANPATQASVDRARSSAHASLRRLLASLRRFQSDRWLRAEVLRDGFDEDYIGIADADGVIKGFPITSASKPSSSWPPSASTPSTRRLLLKNPPQQIEPKPRPPIRAAH
jgi:hypothetical protein